MIVWHWSEQIWAGLDMFRSWCFSLETLALSFVRAWVLRLFGENMKEKVLQSCCQWRFLTLLPKKQGKPGMVKTWRHVPAPPQWGKTVFQWLGLADRKDDLCFCVFVFQKGQCFASLVHVLQISGVFNSHTELFSSVLGKVFAIELVNDCIVPDESPALSCSMRWNSSSVPGALSVVRGGVREGYFLAGELYIFVEPLSHMFCNCLSGLLPPFPVCTSVEVLAHPDNVTVLISHEHIVSLLTECQHFFDHVPSAWVN